MTGKKTGLRNTAEDDQCLKSVEVFWSLMIIENKTGFNEKAIFKVGQL